eukprot:1183423-Amphidinium_carterae.2
MKSCGEGMERKAGCDSTPSTLKRYERMVLSPVVSMDCHLHIQCFHTTESVVTIMTIVSKTLAASHDRTLRRLLQSMRFF